jgi:hypothetical protein
MTDVSGHEADHASDTGSHRHVPVDPNDAVVRAKAPSPRAFLVAAVAALLTLLVLVTAAVAAGQGT